MARSPNSKPARARPRPNGRRKPATRKRRSAEEARAEIVAAAERRMIAAGPDALRLQELAEEVGVSHPAILHHFGSREGLVRAVVARAVDDLQQDLIRAIGDGDQIAGPALLERVYQTLGPGGHARLMAWLLLAGHDPLAGDEVRAKWQAIINTTHAARLAHRSGTKPTHEDTAFTVTLSALAIFAQSIVGDSTFRASGLAPSAKLDARFLSWLALLLGEHLSR